jgi:arsenate reductase (thioredoxin)
MTDRQRVLFVCTHNSARSQMAEGILRAWGGDRYAVESAGTEQTTVRAEAIAVMREIEIDIGDHTSKTIDRFADEPWDWLITVCDQAAESCPTLPGVQHQAHWSIPDPSAVEGDEAARLDVFRTTRDDIATRIRLFLESTPG